MIYLENKIAGLKKHIAMLYGQTVTYSKVGGGAGSILLVTFENLSSIWLWCYWEISRNNQLLADSNDDDTPIVGKMAASAILLEGKKVVKVYFNDINYMLGIYFEESYELWLYPENQKHNESGTAPNWEFWIPTQDLCYEVTSQLILRTTKYYT